PQPAAAGDRPRHGPPHRAVRQPKLLRAGRAVEFDVRPTLEHDKGSGGELSPPEPLHARFAFAGARMPRRRKPTNFTNVYMMGGWGLVRETPVQRPRFWNLADQTQATRTAPSADDTCLELYLRSTR